MIQLVGDLAVGTTGATPRRHDVVAGGAVDAVVVPHPLPQHQHWEAGHETVEETVQARAFPSPASIIAQHARRAKGSKQT